MHDESRPGALGWLVRAVVGARAQWLLGSAIGGATSAAALRLLWMMRNDSTEWDPVRLRCCAVGGFSFGAGGLAMWSVFEDDEGMAAQAGPYLVLRRRADG